MRLPCLVLGGSRSRPARDTAGSLDGVHVVVHTLHTALWKC